MWEKILARYLTMKRIPWQRVAFIILIAAVFYFIGRQKRSDGKEDQTENDQRDRIQNTRKFALGKDSINQEYVKIIIQLNADKQAMAKELYETYKQKTEEDQKTIKRQDSVLKILKKL